MGENFSAIILAAGYSGRMGQHKALLEYEANRCFARKIADDFLAFGCNRVIMVTNPMVAENIKEEDFNLNDISLVVNTKPELGRFYSLSLGLSDIEPNQHIFVTNVDNPMVSDQALFIMADNAGKAYYIFPVYRGRGGHPILLSPEIIALIKKETTYDYNIKEYLSRFSKIGVEVNDESILININSPAEYERVIQKK